MLTNSLCSIQVIFTGHRWVLSCKTNAQNSILRHWSSKPLTTDVLAVFSSHTMSDKLRELREREHLCTYQILNNSIFKKIIHFTASFSHENAVILEFEFNLKVLGIVNLAPRSYRVTLTEVCNYLTVIIDHCCCHLCYHFYHYSLSSLSMLLSLSLLMLLLLLL